MKKHIGNIIQGIAGFGVVLMLWCLGAISHQYSYENFEFYISSIFYYLPTIAVFMMPVLLLLFAFIGKKYDLKALYFSALIGVLLPVMAYVGSCAFSDDGNILSWIFGFTIGLVLAPFHRLAWSTFDCVWTADYVVNTDFCAGFLVVSIVLSLIIYFHKNKKLTIKQK